MSPVQQGLEEEHVVPDNRQVDEGWQLPEVQKSPVLVQHWVDVVHAV